MPIYDDIHEGVFEYKRYGNCVFKPSSWDSGSRNNIIAWNATKHSNELNKSLNIGALASPEVKKEIIAIIQRHWDCFCDEGSHRTILGYEFAIDTGDHTPICCKKPCYGFHESKVMMQQIHTLLGNCWIKKCGGPWGSLIVLAAKPHQESVTNIVDFIWRMCVSYRALNRITKPFQFLIPRCDDSIYMLGGGSVLIFVITLDAKQGYHQIAVKYSDQEKLDFFAPDDYKYCYTVMPFGPTNALTFYTAMMRNFKEEWDNLFLAEMSKLTDYMGRKISKNQDGAIFVDGKRLTAGSRSIIDDILIWSSHKELVLMYFECVCRVFVKYRASFKLSKCFFLQERVEYVGHDILYDGTTTASSKFNMINDWPLPTRGQSLFSFIGLISFYHKFAPYHEVRIKPLRRLNQQYYCQEIPLMAWSPDLIQLFDDMKKAITLSIITKRYDPSAPVFLKTD